MASGQLENRRLWRVLVGGALVGTSAMLLGNVNLSSLEIGDYRPFAYSPPEEQDAIPSVWDASGSRSVNAVVTSVAEFRLSLELPLDDPLLADVAEGAFRTFPERLVWAVADVRVAASTDSNSIPIRWSPPTVGSGAGQTPVITLLGRTPTLVGDVQLLIASGHQVDFSIRSEGRTVAAVLPHDVVGKQTASMVEGSLGGPQALPASSAGVDKVTIELDAPETTPSQTEPLLGQRTLDWLNLAARMFWPLVPWLVVRRRLLGEAGPPSPSQKAAMYLLLALGLGRHCQRLSQLHGTSSSSCG